MLRPAFFQSYNIRNVLRFCFVNETACILNSLMEGVLAAAGGVAAFMQIAESSLRLSRHFHDFLRNNRNAPREIETLQLQLSNFSQCLTQFHLIAEEWLNDMDESREKRKLSKRFASLEKECMAVKTGAKELRMRYFPNSSQPVNEPSFLYRVRWYFQKTMVVTLNIMLESAKSSIQLFLTLHIVEVLRKRVTELESALKQHQQHQSPEGPEELRKFKHQL